METAPTTDKIYAYGMRNSFGMDFDPVTGYLWDTENGEDNYDEINLAEEGFNSGWTKVQGLAKYVPNFDPSVDLVKDLSSQSIGKPDTVEKIRRVGEGKYRDPEFVWNVTIGVTAIKFLNSDKYTEQYQNDMFVGDIYNGNPYRFELNDSRTGLALAELLSDRIANDVLETQESVIAYGFGGITDIQIGPDGYLYIAIIEDYYPTINSVGTNYKMLPR
jgi:glucose/arabinose dehydrogenase